jgi:hypothetical protein
MSIDMVKWLYVAAAFYFLNSLIHQLNKNKMKLSKEYEKFIYVFVIVTLWILLFVQDIWVVMLMLTGMAAFAFSIIQSIKNDEKKQ